MADQGSPSGEEILNQELGIAVRRATGAHWHLKELEVTDSSNMDVNIYVNAFKIADPTTPALRRLFQRKSQCGPSGGRSGSASVPSGNSPAGELGSPGGDLGSAPAFGEPVRFWWPYWKEDDHKIQQLENKDGTPRTDFPMSGDSYYAPERGERGPYGVRMEGAASDEVIGIGLPMKRHIKVRIVYEWNEGTVTPPVPPNDDMAARLAALSARVDELENAWLRLRKAVAE